MVRTTAPPGGDLPPSKLGEETTLRVAAVSRGRFDRPNDAREGARARVLPGARHLQTNSKRKGGVPSDISGFSSSASIPIP